MMKAINGNFVIFLLIAFGIATPVFYLSMQQSNPAIVLMLLLVGSYAPALGAWIASRRDGKTQALREYLVGWIPQRWVWFTLLAPSLLWLIAFGIVSVLTSVRQPLWLALAGLPLILLVNYGEEIGWRGYALPVLLKDFNTFTASLVLGVIWALFHVALYVQRPVFGFLTSVVIVLLSIILAWIFVNTGKILAGTLFHGMFNVWTQVLITGASGELFLVVVIVILLVMCGFLLLRYGKGLSIPQ